MRLSIKIHGFTEGFMENGSETRKLAQSRSEKIRQQKNEERRFSSRDLFWGRWCWLMMQQRHLRGKINFARIEKTI